MAVVRIDLEVNDHGAASVISTTGAKIKEMGGHAKATESVVQGMFQGIGQAAFHLMEEIPKLFLEMGKSAVEFAAHTVEHLLHVVHALEGLMAKTGLSAQSAQELGVAMRIAGGDSEALAGMITKMQKALVAGKDSFAALGLDVKKLKDQDVGKTFTEVAEKIRAIKNPTEQTAAMLAIFGKGGAEAARLIKEGVLELSEDAHHLGAILGDEDVKAAAELGKESRRLAVAWESVQNQFAAALLSSHELQEILKALVETMATLAHWVHENRGAIELWVSAGIKEAILGLKTLKEWAEKTGAALLAMAPGLVQMAAAAAALAMSRASAAANEAALTAEAVRLAKEALKPHEPGGGGGFDPLAAEALKKRLAEIDKAMADYKASYVAMENEISAFTIRTHKLALAEDKEFWDEQRKGAEAYGKWYLAYLTSKQAGEQAIANAWRAQEDERLRLLAEELAIQRELGASLRDLGDLIGGMSGALVGFAGAGLIALANLSDEALQAASIWEKLTIAIQGAIGAFKAGQAAGSPGKGALAGAGKGAMAGAAFGPLGMGVGALIGGALGFLGGKSAQKEELKALTAEFEALKQKAAAAGVTIRDSLNPRTAKEFKSAIDEVNRTMDTTAEAQQKLQEAIERYGFTVDELGPTMAKQKLDEQMAQIYQDWQLLNAAGVDHAAMVARIGPVVGTLVDQYVAGGIEIPLAMQPIIEQLFEQGKLLHENGDAYTQAEKDGLTYAKTMSQMFQELIQKVTDLVNAILGIPNKTVTVTVNRVVAPGTTGTEPPTDDPNDPGNRGYASGYFSPSLSSDRWLKAHRGERVEITPAANSRARNAGMGGGQTINVTVNVAGDGDAQKIRDVVQRALTGGYIKVPA